MTKPKHVQLAQQIAASITALQEPVSDEQVLNVFQDCGVYGPTLGDATADGLKRWLERRGAVITSSQYGPIRDLRLRWLDWMIQYCELEEAGWTPWLGGETPPETCSIVKLRDGYDMHMRFPDSRGALRWKHTNQGGDIIAYKP